MKLTAKKTWVGALGLALALTTAGGVALGAGADDWYDGDNATVADPYKTDVGLRLYNASGVEVTTGSTTQPLAAYAAADGVVREGDEFGSLFVHLPESGAAPGAWPALQVTGTDRYAGEGAVEAPAALAGRPFVRTTGAGYSLADVAAALPNTESSDSFEGVYELRLRTSSEDAGVSDEYAAAYLRVSGATWTVTDAPVLGGEGDPEPVATTTAAAWPSRLTYGGAATVNVTVTAASGTAKPTGTVRLLSGSTVLSSATLSAAGTAALPIAKTALAPGSRTLRVAYLGATDSFTASQSAARALTVAKAAPGRPVVRVTKKPTVKKPGTAAVTVATAAGLAKAAGKGQAVLKKGGVTKRINITVTAGKATVKLPKLPKGTWKLTVVYQGSAYYLSATSAGVKVVSK